MFAVVVLVVVAIVAIVIVGLMIFLFVALPLIEGFSWTPYISVAVRSLLNLAILISAIVLYRTSRWAAKNFCPVKLQFSPTDS